MIVQEEAKDYEDELRDIAGRIYKGEISLSRARIRLNVIADFLSMVAAQKEGGK